jgi:hypothetical protein
MDSIKKMETTMKYRLAFSILLLFSVLFAAPKAITVEELVNNPGRYLESAVQISGMAVSYDKGVGENTGYYILEDDFGNRVRINTSGEMPQKNHYYTVTGTVYQSNVRGSAAIPVISEQNREEIKKSDQTLLYVLLAALLAVLLGLLLYFVISGRKKPVVASPEPVVMPQSPAGQLPEQPRSDLSTIKIQIAPPTMRFMPGKLEIVTEGADKGKSFPMAGYPTNDGNIVTVGRDEVSGERQYSHIQLSKYPTLSRQQAEFREKNGKVSVRNLSKTNVTQVNGSPLQDGLWIELGDKDLIQMGELKFQYHL